MSSSIGKLFTVTSFGESHGRCVGVLLDGCPAGLPLDTAEIQLELERRRPGQEAFATRRAEPDEVEILSGVFNGHTTGAPIAMLTWNCDVNSASYDDIKNHPRPGHADYTAEVKYGGFQDYRGGGRFSGRLTVGLVMAGALARKLLSRLGVEVIAHTVAIGGVEAAAQPLGSIRQASQADVYRCADASARTRMAEVVAAARQDGDSLGGIVEGLVLNLPAGLGEPYFDTLEGELAKGLFAIPAVKGVEFGGGFRLASLRGSEANDAFRMQEGRVVTATNHAGGILGGISNGMPLVTRVAIKPVPSISVPQETVDLSTGEDAALSIRGRHDACIVPRAVPVVEAMLAIVLCDMARRAGLLQEVLK